MNMAHLIPAQKAKPVHQYAEEFAEIQAIYRRLYPGRCLHFYLYQGDNPIWSNPTVIDGRIELGPHHLSPEFIGRFVSPGSFDDAAVTSIMLSIPRPPTSLETRCHEKPWQPKRMLRPLFKLSPLAFEQARYVYRKFRDKRADGRQVCQSIARGPGATSFSSNTEHTDGKPPAILIGMHWLEIGGAERLAFDTIEWARQAGLKVYVVAATPSLQRLAHQLNNDTGIDFIRLDRWLPLHLWPSFVERLITAENIRLVHIHHCQPLYDSLPQIRASTPWVKVIDSTHIVESDGGGFTHSSGRWTNYIDLHHVISGDLLLYFREKFHLAGRLRLGRMRDRHERFSHRVPFRFTAGQSAVHIAFIGRLCQQKRPVILVEALRALFNWAAAEGVTMTATIVGDGPYRDIISRLIRQYSLDDTVQFLDESTDVPVILRRSDIILLPSSNEGLALVCDEAVTHGCIPLATNVGSQSEQLPAEIMLPTAPVALVSKAVELIDRMWKDAWFLDRQKAALQCKREFLDEDPSAKDVLMPLYREAATAGAKISGDYAA